MQLIVLLMADLGYRTDDTTPDPERRPIRSRRERAYLQVTNPQSYFSLLLYQSLTDCTVGSNNVAHSSDKLY